MKNLIRRRVKGLIRKELRPTRFALAAVVVGALAAGAAAAPGGAAHPARAHAGRAFKEKFKQPKLEHGLLSIEGTEAGDAITLRLEAGDPGTLQVDVGDDGSTDFRFARRKIDAIVVDARGGDDRVRIDESNGVFTDVIPTTIDGGNGNDDLAGGSGAELLLGGAGNDSIDGNRGNDAAFMGSGDDTFVWDPGDGSDTVDGQDGADTMVFNGAGAAERFDLSANGSRLKFVRDVGNITMDTSGVENVDVNALGGADAVTVNDLSGTGVTSVRADLGAGDGQADHVTVNGSNGPDRIGVAGSNGSADVTGLAAAVSISNAEPANDTLTVNALGGADTVAASTLAATSVRFESNGGDDADVLIGSAGNDLIDGGKGNDTASLGAGDDTFVWDPGDGSDTVEGQDGADTMVFNGAGAAERFDLSANGSRLKFVRDVGNITMDTSGVENVDVNALGGADAVTVNDLSGTDVSDVNVDLGGALGAAGGDAQPDRVVVNASNDDAIDVNGDAGGIKVSGLAATVAILNSEAANDRLEVNTLAGRDTVDSGGLAAGAIQLFVNGALRP
jgi:Ca2+-binding RTX toxin-like protein